MQVEDMPEAAILCFFLIVQKERSKKMDIIFLDETGEVLSRFRGVSKAKQKQIEGILTGKDSKKGARFTAPTVDEVRAYCAERGNSVDAQRFVDYYEASGWKRNRGVPLADWKAAVRNWERSSPLRRDTEKNAEKKLPSSLDLAEVERGAMEKYRRLKGEAVGD